MGGLGGATANMLLLIPELSFGGACLLRFLTGVAMAFVYPPGMKAAATWFKKGRGLGLGAMVGALCVGSALPNVIVGVRWETVIIATSAVAAFGALLMLVGSDGPFPFKGVSHFQCALVGKCLVSTASWKRDFVLVGWVDHLALCRQRNSGTMLAIGAYTCHNWELYAMWSWFKAFTATALLEEHGYGSGSDDLYTEAEANDVAGKLNDHLGIWAAFSKELKR